MKENWKIGYLMLLIVISLVYLLQRWSIITDGNATIFDILIGIIFLVLILSPLFSEIKLFGFSFKSELKELKNELRNEIINLRSEINNNINFNPSFNLNSTVLTKEDVDELLQEHKRADSKNQDDILNEISIPDETKDFFKIRFALESKLLEISKKIKAKYPELNENFRPPTRVIRYLRVEGFINEKLGNAIKYVYNTSSSVIHGEEIHKMTIDNVKELAPIVINELDEILQNEYT